MLPSTAAHTVRYVYTAHRVQRYILDGRQQVIDVEFMKRGPADPPDGTIVEHPFSGMQLPAPSPVTPSPREPLHSRQRRRPTQRMARVLRGTLQS